MGNIGDILCIKLTAEDQSALIKLNIEMAHARSALVLAQRDLDTCVSAITEKHVEIAARNPDWSPDRNYLGPRLIHYDCAQIVDVGEHPDKVEADAELAQLRKLTEAVHELDVTEAEIAHLREARIRLDMMVEGGGG